MLVGLFLWLTELCIFVLSVSMRLGILGAGSYGTALAIFYAAQGHDITLWCRREALVDELKKHRENKDYLHGFSLPENIVLTSKLQETVVDKDIVFLVVPVCAIREILTEIVPYIEEKTILINTSKGFEKETQKRVDSLCHDIFPDSLLDKTTYLGGPTFAKEVAKQLPSAAVIAGYDHALVGSIVDSLSVNSFRLYPSTDVVGVTVGGALKNVIAIASGISDGLGLGYNAGSALITEGLQEISRIGVALGAKETTFYGLSGIGDLVLTCQGELSRNRNVGLLLGQGRTLHSIQSSMRMIVEGVDTTNAAFHLSQQWKIRAPIIESVYQVLYERKSTRDVFQTMMNRY